MKTTIHTKKDVYQDTDSYIQEKDQLFKNLTISSIQKELALNDIYIDEKEVCQKYQETYQIDDVIGEYDEKYEKQLDCLGSKNEVFDDDAFIYLIKKIVEKHFDIHQVPDKAYLVSDIQGILAKAIPYTQLLQETANILKRLVLLKEYEKQDHLGVIFNPYMLDIDGFITRVFQDVKSVELDQTLISSFIDLMIQLNQLYRLPFRYSEIVSDLYECLVKVAPLQTSKTYLEQLKKQFPQKTFNFYYALLNQLQNNHPQSCLQCYQEALEYKPYNEEQADLKQLIKDLYEGIL